MPIEFQDVFARATIEANPNKTYVYGDNCARKGYGGQAAACRGMANTIGIRTKFLPKRTRDAYFSDDYYDHCCAMIAEDLAVVEEVLKGNRVVVFPSGGLGTGLANLPEKAPRVYQFLSDSLDKLFHLYGVPTDWRRASLIAASENVSEFHKLAG